MTKVSTQKAIGDFLLSCEAEGLAPSTLRWYRSILNTLSKSPQIPSRLDKVGGKEIRSFLVDLRRDEYSPDTVDDYTRALHRFFKWCVKEYDLKNAMGNIRYPSQPQSKEPKTASLEDIFAMFQAAGEGMSPARDRAILAFALDTGARAGGICTLRFHDVDLQKRTAWVTEKGSKTRAVVFTKVTGAILQDWIDMRQESPSLFYNLDTLEALTPNGLLQLFRRLGKRAGVKGRYNPHSFRHTFGKEYVKAGGDVFTLARIMGHTDINTTAQHYAVFTSEEVSAAQEKYSPIQKLFKGDEK